VNGRILLMTLMALLLASCATSTVDLEKQARLANIHYQLGMDALSKQGMLPKAFHELMKSDELLPDQAAVLDALAYAWLLRGEMKKSETLYQRAIEHGGGAASYNNYANMLNRVKRYPEAETAARKALDDPRYPNQDLAFINLGDALLGQHKPHQAIASYREALIFKPGNGLINIRLAHAYFKADKLREAHALYEMIIHKQPGNRQAVEGLIAVLESGHNQTAKRRVLNAFIRHSSEPLDKAWAQNELDHITTR